MLSPWLGPLRLSRSGSGLKNLFKDSSLLGQNMPSKYATTSNVRYHENMRYDVLCVCVIANKILYSLISSFTNRKSGRRWMTCEGRRCLSAPWRRSLTITTPSCLRLSAANTTSASCHSLTRTRSSRAAPFYSIIRFVFNNNYNNNTENSCQKV